MPLTIQDYKNHILTSNIRKPKMKVEFLRYEDETVMYEVTGDIEGSSGSITVNNVNGLRRSIDFTLINIDNNTYIPSFDGLIWIRRKIKLWLGLEIGGEIIYFPSGVFVMDNPSCSSDPSKSLMTIKALDKFSLLNGELGGHFDLITQINMSENIYSVIEDALVLCGDKKSPILCSEYMTAITPYTIEKEDSTWGEIILEFASMLSANVYYNVNGELVFEVDTNDAEKGSDWDFSETDYNYLGATKEYKFNEVFNAVIVVCDNMYGTTIKYEAINNNLLSETSVPNLGYKISKIIVETNIETLELAEPRAKYELKRVIALQSNVNISCVPMYHLLEDGVVTLTDSKLKLTIERLLVQGFTIPFKIGSNMSVDTVKSIELLL